MHHTDLAVYRNLQGRLYRAAEIIDSVATALRLFDAADPQVKLHDGTIYILVDGTWQTMENVHHVLTATGQTLVKLINMVEADLAHGELT